MQKGVAEQFTKKLLKKLSLLVLKLPVDPIDIPGKQYFRDATNRDSVKYHDKVTNNFFVVTPI